MSSAEKVGTHFLNVDLDLGAGHGLDDLIRFLETRAFVLHQEDSFTTLELNGDVSLSLEETVLGFVELAESMPAEVRMWWDGCGYRKMNIGIQAGLEPHQALFALSEKAVSSMAAAHCEILITVYRPG